VSYLLDTNACIALINGRPPSVRRRFEEASQASAQLSTSSVVTFELWYGVATSARPETMPIGWRRSWRGHQHPRLR
jgi:tRNA(fMet)-specific endonuclease VapC